MQLNKNHRESLLNELVKAKEEIELHTLEYILELAQAYKEIQEEEIN